MFPVLDQNGQINRNAKALAKAVKINTSSGSRLYGNYFKLLWTILLSP